MTPGPSSPCSASPLLPVPPGLPAASAAPREIRSSGGTDAASRNRHRERKRQNHAPGCGRRGKPGRGRNAAEEKPEQLPQPFPGPFPAPLNLVFSLGGVREVAFCGGSFLGSTAEVSRKGSEKEALCKEARSHSEQNKRQRRGGRGGAETFLRRDKGGIGLGLLHAWKFLLRASKRSKSSRGPRLEQRPRCWAAFPWGFAGEKNLLLPKGSRGLVMCAPRGGQGRCWGEAAGPKDVEAACGEALTQDVIFQLASER